MDQTDNHVQYNAVTAGAKEPGLHPAIIAALMQDAAAQVAVDVAVHVKGVFVQE